MANMQKTKPPLQPDMQDDEERIEDQLERLKELHLQASARLQPRLVIF